VKFSIEATAVPDLEFQELLALLQILNEQGRSSPIPFGTAVTPGPSSDPSSQIAAQVSVAYPAGSSPIAVAEMVASAILSALTSRGGSGRVRIEQTEAVAHPGAGDEEIARLAATVAAGVSEPTPPPHLPSWFDPRPDARGFRLFVAQLSGLTAVGIVESLLVEDNTQIYAGRCGEGQLLLTEEEGGWSLALIVPGDDGPSRVWTTAPSAQALVLELALPMYLGMEDADLAAEFRHIEYDGAVERKHFTTAIGPVVVHTRKVSPEATVETVVEARGVRVLFSLEAREVYFGTPDELTRMALEAVPF
jgi:hypothetical protein